LTHLKELYSSAAWSPDGSYIAFIIFPNDAYLSLSAYVMKADGSDLRLLSKSVEGALSWSPDNRTLAFISKQSGTRQIYIIAIDGSGLRQLTDGNDEVYGLMWSPDGQHIIFNRSDYKLYVINADGTGQHQLQSTSSDEMAVWSPDGKSIAFSSSRT